MNRQADDTKPLPHVVWGLIAKRAEIAGQIEVLQAQLRQSVIDLDHVAAALLLLDPDVDMAALPARKVAPVSFDTKVAYRDEEYHGSTAVAGAKATTAVLMSPFAGLQQLLIAPL